MNDEEARHALESSQYFIILPALRAHHDGGRLEHPGLETRVAKKPYNSANDVALDYTELRTYLAANRLI